MVYAMNWIVSPPNSYVDALTPNVTLFEDRAFKELIKVKWGHKERLGPDPIELVSL